MGKHVRCCLALEAYIHGGSVVYFGLEPARFPFIQIQFAPRTRLSLRFPILSLTEFKSIFAGGSFTLYDNGSRPKPVWNGWKPLWRSVEQFVTPIIELQHRTTILGSVLDSEQRRALRAAVEKASAKQKEKLRHRARERMDMVKGFDPPEIPNLDPRRRPDAIDRLRVKMRERFGDQGIVRGSAMEKLWEDAEKRYSSEDIAGQREELRKAPEDKSFKGGNDAGFLCLPPRHLPRKFANLRRRASGGIDNK